jgi:uncharacterized lipoprotein YmbA
MARQPLGWAATLAVLLGGCASSSPPPLLLHLPAVVPAAAVQKPAAPSAASATTYQLVLPVRLPDYLDRAELLVPQGAVLSPMPGVRWAEPLREAVPRLLRADLAALLGPGRLWSAPLPPGVVPQRQWRVEITAFEADTARSLVRLQASWSLADARGARPARVGAAEIEALAADGSAASLAVAHRVALRRLAERIAAAADHLD